MPGGNLVDRMDNGRTVVAVATLLTDANNYVFKNHNPLLMFKRLPLYLAWANSALTVFAWITVYNIYPALSVMA